MGDIWFCVVIILFEYFAQFVAHEQTRVTLVALSGNAFDDYFSAEEIKMVLAQNVRREFGFANLKMCDLKDVGNASPGSNLHEKRTQTCRWHFLDVVSSKQTRVNSSIYTAKWTFGIVYLPWDNMKFIIGLFLYSFILKYAVEILRNCGPKDVVPSPASRKTTNIISEFDDHSDISSKSSIEISELEKRLASGSAFIIPHLPSAQTKSSSLASSASFVRKSGGCLGVIYNFNCYIPYTNSSPDFNQNGFGEAFMQPPSMRIDWLKAQSVPSIFYVNRKKKWYSKGTIDYVCSTSSKDHRKKWTLAESSAGCHEQCHSASLSSLQNENDYVKSSSLRTVAANFTVNINGETSKNNQVVNQTSCWSSVEDFNVHGSDYGLPLNGTRCLSLPMVYPSFDKSLSQDVDEDLNVTDEMENEDGPWKLNDSFENQQQLNVTEDRNSFHNMIKDIWTDIKVESHHQIIVPLLLHTAKACVFEYLA